MKPTRQFSSEQFWRTKGSFGKIWVHDRGNGAERLAILEGGLGGFSCKKEIVSLNLCICGVFWRREASTSVKKISTRWTLDITWNWVTIKMCGTGKPLSPKEFIQRRSTRSWLNLSDIKTQEVFDSKLDELVPPKEAKKRSVGKGEQVILRAKESTMRRQMFNQKVSHSYHFS